MLYVGLTRAPDSVIFRAQAGAASSENIIAWKRKLNALLRSADKQELVSREKKDRRDFEQIAALAGKMGLYSHLYMKVVVVSKVPLPNYRFDLDDKRPQREESPGGRKMMGFRCSLPAYKEKDTILNAISQNQVVIISGETGCGKTTQIPQFILECEAESMHGAMCNIICTQPRRISAMSVSERIATERGENLGETVGYKVRLEGMKGRDTHLLFCTTGILLRRLLIDRNLKGVTHIIVDEIHERGINEGILCINSLRKTNMARELTDFFVCLMADFLLIVLKDLLPRRPELRLILMSATLDAELFSSYFGGAPVVQIPGFTYPVRTHFLENILETTGYQLTPYNQIDDYGIEKMWKMSKQTPRKRKSQIASAVEDTLSAADFKDYSALTRESLSNWNPDCLGFNLIEYLLCNICENERPGAVLVFMTGWDDITSLKISFKLILY
ncbi:UNVERIFIED_CONTAM: DExH-box ATP-dependent RNA helicase DExH5, mitochondrial [Sesamum angustifolium]|uniref:RNA helicase n=1 Tax=Sesamum angustifolium TaxID=2727405 RepID=A0AAW2RMW8_9LAMI